MKIGTVEIPDPANDSFAPSGVLATFLERIMVLDIDPSLMIDAITSDSEAIKIIRAEIEH